MKTVTMIYKQSVSFLSVLLCVLWLNVSELVAQSKADSITEEVKSKVFNHFKNFTIGFYLDTYYNWTLGNGNDTSTIIPFSSNSPVQDQIRINHAAIEMYYNAEKVRGKFALQFGDAPNLLATPDAQFIRNLRQANFGFRVIKGLWIDVGYIFNPIGFESAWSAINQVSTVTTGGYFEPGSLLGFKVSYQITDKFTTGLMFGNPFSVAYGKNQHMAGIFFINYEPTKQISITYNNFWGNQALVDAEIDNTIFYNNLIFTYNPVKKLDLTGQLDFAFQTNSHLPPDTNKTAGMYSGFLMARYQFTRQFSITAQYQFFNDPNGFLSGRYDVKGKLVGLSMQGFTVGAEFRPVEIGYVRVEYRYLLANKDNLVFFGKTSDLFQAITLTTGIRF